MSEAIRGDEDLEWVIHRGGMVLLRGPEVGRSRATDAGDHHIDC
jgi:hypothetical protein